MSILSGLWAGAKAVMGIGTSGGDGANNVMKVASGIGNYIDEQEFTTEEKAAHTNVKIGHMGSFMASTVSENTQRSKARREITLLVMRWALAMLTLSVVLYKVDPELSKYIRDIVTDDPMGYFVLGIGAFFFGAHIVRAMKNQ